MRFKEDIGPEFAKSNTEELRKDRVQTDNPTEPRLSPEQIEEVGASSASTVLAPCSALGSMDFV
jgi:hypothetical protein